MPYEALTFPLQCELWIENHAIENWYILLHMQQATRVADMTAFFNAEEGESGDRFGYLVEYDRTENILENPQEESTQNMSADILVKMNS